MSGPKVICPVCAREVGTRNVMLEVTIAPHGAMKGGTVNPGPCYGSGLLASATQANVIGFLAQCAKTLAGTPAGDICLARMKALKGES